MCLKKLPGLLRGGVGWGLGTMFARQGDIEVLEKEVNQIVFFSILEKKKLHIWKYFV